MNLLLWFRERFPAISLLTALILTTSTLTVFRFFANSEALFFWTDLGVALGLLAQLLFLRIVDEHKDYQDDLIIHPNRVLQKGLVSLTQLKVLGGLCVVVMCLVNVALGLEQTWFWWGVMMVWTTLMTLEFFVKKFLKKRLMLYSVSHLCVLPLMVLWVGSFTESFASGWSLNTLFFIGFVFVNGLVYEIVRKSKTPLEKAPSELLFSDLWSPKVWSLWLVSLLVSVGLLSVAMLYGQVHIFTILVLTAALTMAILSVRSFAQDPNQKSKKAIDGSTAIYSLLAYLSILTTLFVV